jgi:hypothetical protein
MATVFNTDDTIFFVGGTGTKTGLANAGGCTKAWYDDNFTQLSDIMGSDGACIDFYDGAVYTHSTKRISRTGAFTNSEIGMVVYVYDNQGVPTITTGRYKITDVDPSGNWIEVNDIVATGDSNDVVANVGGAFDKLQTALDNTDASAAAPHSVDILTNKAKTFSVIGDQIDVDTGGGSGASGTWKRIIGINDNGIELAKDSYVDFDGNGQACHIFKVLDVENIEFRHIYAHDSANTYYGFYITATGYRQGFLLKDCKSTGCKYGVYSDTFYIRGLTIMGGYYSSATGPALCFQACRWVHVLGVELVGSLAGALIDGDVIGTLLVDGCVLRKTDNYSLGICSNNWDTFLVIRNCVFYDIDYCIEIADPESRLVQYNNIFILHTAATGKVINRASGAIKYSDYSCAWAIDGAPTASSRWGGTGLPEHSIEQDPQFVDADNGDFRQRNQNVLRGGKPDIADNETEMGAILQKYQFAKRAKAANPGRLQIMR